MKYLFLIFFILLAYGLWRFRVARQQSGTPRPATKQSEPMVRCDVCGVYFPKSEGIVDGANVYCSEAHHKLSTQGH